MINKQDLFSPATFPICIHCFKLHRLLRFIQKNNSSEKQLLSSAGRSIKEKKISQGIDINKQENYFTKIDCNATFSIACHVENQTLLYDCSAQEKRSPSTQLLSLVNGSVGKMGRNGQHIQTSVFSYLILVSYANIACDLLAITKHTCPNQTFFFFSFFF